MTVVEYTCRRQVGQSKERCIEAAVSAVKKTDGFILEKVDRASGVIYIKSKMSLLSFGELVEIRFSEIVGGLTEISVTSVPRLNTPVKIFGIYCGVGKNERNVIKIMNAFSLELKKFPCRPVIGSLNADNVFEKIRELGRLRYEGLITFEEFDDKKTELLSRI